MEELAKHVVNYVYPVGKTWGFFQTKDYFPGYYYLDRLFPSTMVK